MLGQKVQRVQMHIQPERNRGLCINQPGGKKIQADGNRRRKQTSVKQQILPVCLILRVKMKQNQCYGDDKRNGLHLGRQFHEQRTPLYVLKWKSVILKGLFLISSILHNVKKEKKNL